MAHTRSWDETSPAGTDLASTLDNTVRNKLVDVRERMALDHVWNSSTDHDGKHLRVRLRPAADVTPLSTDSANSLTGSTAGGVADLSQTWNTTGVCTGFKLNITDTASDAASLLLDLQKGGTSQFKVSKAGALTLVGGITAGSGTVGIVDSTGKVPAISSTYFASLSGANLTALNASNLDSGTVPLARLSDIANAQIAAAAAIAYSKLALTDSILDADINSAAAIAWSKISKTSSSLADLATRSASDLNSGTLASGRLSGTYSEALTFDNASNSFKGVYNSADGSAGITSTFNPTTITSMTFKNGLLTAKS